MGYFNAMETVVEQAYEDLLPSLDCCSCPRCRTDVLCYALNHVPPHYADTAEGAQIVKALMGGRQELADIRAAVVQAAELVRRSPRH